MTLACGTFGPVNAGERRLVRDPWPWRRCPAGASGVSGVSAASGP